VESRQEVENVSEMVCNSLTDSREAQSSRSDGATTEDVRTESSGLDRMLADHTPQVVTTHRCKPKARLLTSVECLRTLQEKEDKKKQQFEEKERKQKEREQKKKF